ncbi:MAG TPA: TonB-dependent receptor [Pyrinomonadaceae bacterium]|jgi:outer membrane receptor protein involved in Fe transport|nr:TonB-dependent receptor [Pyrinomonadaceae bacterium]
MAATEAALRSFARRSSHVSFTKDLCFVRHKVILACALVMILAFGLRASAATYAWQEARLEGIVLDQKSAPVAGAQVSLKTGTSVIAEVTTDIHGIFVFETIPVRDATLIVRATGFSPSERRWTAIEGNGSRLQVVLLPAPVSAEVTVTATRTETRLSDTAASIVVLSSAELSTTAAATIDDALRQVPGFQLFRRSGSRTANPTSQGVSLRGVGASGASRAVVLLDGIPLNDPFGGWVNWGRIPRESVSRIEVLRGGASNLYGSDAVGGVVQIITRRTVEPVLSVEASYGNQRTPSLSLFAGGRARGWDVSLAGELFHTDGYILVDEKERGSVDTPAGSRHAALDLTLARQIKRDARVFLRGSYFGESRTNGTPLQINRTHLRQLSVGGDWQSKSTGAFAVRAYGGTQVFDQSFSAVAANRNSELLTRLQRVPAQVFGFTSQWSRVVGASHTLVAGFDARFVRGASDEVVYAQNRPTSFVGAGGRERTAGVFALDIIRVNSRLLLTGGARFDSWRNYAAQSVTRPVKQSGAATINAFNDRSETALSPQLSALYKASDALSFSASVYRAFRAPALNELYRSFRVGDVLTLANERLRAERLTGGEAGASIASFKRNLNARGTLFWTEIERPIANVTLSVAPTLITRQRENLGRTRSRGLELEMDARLKNRWTISGGYLFSDARVTSFPVNLALEGLLIPQVARHQLTFQMRYANPKLVTVGLQGRLMGMQFDDDQNRFPLKRYFTLDAFVSRRVAHGVEAFVAIENLFNERYQIGRTPINTLGPPLLWRVGLRLHLGTGLDAAGTR